VGGTHIEDTKKVEKMQKPQIAFIGGRLKI